MTNNLIIFYKDGSKDVFSFSLDVSEQDALGQLKTMRPNAKGTDVKKYFYVQNDDTSADIYGKYAQLTEDGRMKINHRSLLIKRKKEDIRAKRDIFLSRLDVPFMRSLEDGDTKIKEHIIKLKNFLRDVPDNLNLEDLKDGEIIGYNPFANIFEIVLLDGGSGYTEPPKVVVDSPNPPNSAAEAISFVEDGKVSRVELINYGCGYDFIPKITIEPSQSGQQALAFCMFPQNAMFTDEDLKEATRKHYLSP